ncbi:hypothetical protein ZWY2020_002170 [Hordeum vulgare]|nr:hypothetical protein ZWY2020_002170 [Hordeum vulgare]
MSWSGCSSAPGFRRASGRRETDHGGCGYVEWHDDPLPKFFSDLIGDLRDEVRRLKGGGVVAGTEDSFGVVAMHEAEAGTEMLALSLQEQLRLKNEDMDAMKSKYMNVIFVLIVFVIGLVLGKFVVN